jgi:hypothetical protein
MELDGQQEDHDGEHDDEPSSDPGVGKVNHDAHASQSRLYSEPRRCIGNESANNRTHEQQRKRSRDLERESTVEKV